MLSESQEPYLVYLAALFKAQVHEDAGRLPQAAAFYRFALKIAPGAQSASLALSHVQLMMGLPVAAVGPVADAVRPQSAGTGTLVDPWWFYRLRQYWHTDDWIARLRTMVNR